MQSFITIPRRWCRHRAPYPSHQLNKDQYLILKLCKCGLESRKQVVRLLKITQPRYLKKFNASVLTTEIAEAVALHGSKSCYL